MSVVEKLANHLTDEQMEKVGHRVRRFMEEVRNDPQFRAEVLEKTAIMTDPTKMKTLLGLLAGGGAIGIGSGLAATAYNKISKGIETRQLAAQKPKYYKAMIEANPDLGSSEVSARDVQKHFNTLFKFNPQYASDPVVAGTYVTNSLEMARPSLDTVNNLVQARRNMIEARGENPAMAATKTVSTLAGMAGKAALGG